MFAFVSSFWRAALLAALAFLLPAFAYADGIPVEHLRELMLTLEVRKALLDDPELAKLNVGVKVDGRVATLWGPVPTAEIKQRAEDVLKKFPYVSEVRNQLQVRTEDLLLPFPTGVNQWLKRDVVSPQSAVPHREPPANGSLTRRSPSQTAVKVDAPSAHTTLSPKTDSPPAGKSMDLESPEAIEKRVVELQRSHERYTGIRVRVLAHDVLLSADEANSAALYEMAQTVARLPGVARVIVREQ